LQPLWAAGLRAWISPVRCRHLSLWVAGAAIVLAFVVQLYLGSMVLGAMADFLLFSATGVIRWQESDGVLIVGLFLTMGIGSSFSTIPIIAAIYVPLCTHLGFSPLAIVALVGTAGALGDAGSPASDSTLGPTAGLNADGQHNHMRDTVIPTFIHFNLPLLAAGWVAAMVL